MFFLFLGGCQYDPDPRTIRGAFDAAARAYYEDPERVELEIVENYVTDYEIRKVDVLQIP